MALQKDRTKIFVKGLGNFFVAESEPSAATSFSNAGHFKSAIMNKAVEMTEIYNDLGHLVNTLVNKQTIDIVTELLQTGTDEINLLTGAATKIHAARLYGLTSSACFQYFCIPKGRIVPNVSLNYQPGERLLPCRIVAVYQDPGYNIPLFYFKETAAELYLDNMTLWLDPALGYNSETAKVLDCSGFERHGDLSATSAVTTIWQQGTPAEFLRFDGTTDYVSCGNILNDDATSDFVIEAWVRVQAADSSLQEMLGKRSTGTHTAGFYIYRKADNTIYLRLGDGSAHADIASTGTLLQNVWKHIAFAIDRNGNGQCYINGVADGSAVDVSGVATATNSVNFQLGKEGASANYGQLDIGAVRVHNYGAGGLPTDIAARLLSHYNAEKTAYGL